MNIRVAGGRNIVLAAALAVGVTLLGVGAASVHYLARPHLFTFIFLIATIWTVDRDLRGKGIIIITEKS